MKPLNLLSLKGVPIYEQLQIEEFLLRGDSENWCIIAEQSPAAIVMGISGKVDELINQEKMRSSYLPLIKRFSGGGTVVIDENTLFVTFIFQKSSHDFFAFPEPIMKWSEALYQNCFPFLRLKENDYVIGEKKCGGNAQYIKKDRWLHHTSFLWDYDPAMMEYLLHPKKTPSYRAGRSHDDFLIRLKEHLPEKAAFFSSLKSELSKRYLIKELSMDEITLSKEFRQSTSLLDLMAF